MRKKEEKKTNIKDLMELFIKANKLEKGLVKIDIEEAWTKMMGPGVANNTREVRIQNGTLIVALTSSVLREELSYGKDKIIKMINEEMNEDVVQRLMLV